MLSQKEEIKMLAEYIMNSNKGKAVFTLTEAQGLTGVGENSIHHFLTTAGVTVRKFGNKKLVTAYGIATAICANRKATYDNTSKGA